MNLTKPDLLRAYASIFEKPRRDRRTDGTSVLNPPSEISLAAAEALRFQAEALEKETH